MCNFIGKSGRFYAKNNFDNGKYSYAIFLSQESYNTPFERGYVSHTDNETAFADHMKDVESGFIFTVKVHGQKDEKIRVGLNGEMEDGNDLKEHLANLINTHGRENVNYSYQRIL